MASTVIGKQAVVIGAGIAGLAAAGALSDRFDQVVVLERDTLPSEPAHRAGTPQARHVHALLLSGQRALSELFPGFDTISLGGSRTAAGPVSMFALNARAMILLPYATSAGLFTRRHGRQSSAPCDGGWKAAGIPRCTSAAGCRKCWRRQMEMRSPACATRTATARAKRLRHPSSSTPPDAALSLSLCCNRSAAPSPEETTIGIDLGYATCVFGIPHDASTDWKGVMTFGQAPQNSRGGLMLPLEGNRWMATIGGRHGYRPPGNAEGFPELRQGAADADDLQRDQPRQAPGRGRALRLPAERTASFRAT